MDGTATWFDGESLKMAGRVHFPSAMGEAVYADFDVFTLGADGCIITRPQPGRVAFRAAGWDCQAEGHVFDRSGLKIAHIYINLPGTGVAIDFPDTDFYADGTPKGDLRCSERYQLPMFGGGMIIFRLQDRRGRTWGVEMHLCNIRLDDERLQISKGRFILPPLLDQAEVRAISFSLDGTGRFDFSNLGIECVTEPQVELAFPASSRKSAVRCRKQETRRRR